MPGRKCRKLKVYQNVNGTSRQSNYKTFKFFGFFFHFRNRTVSISFGATFKTSSNI